VRSVSRPIYAMNFEENASHAQLVTGSIAAMDGRWKFVEYKGWLHYPLMPILGDELYDLSADPDERKNLLKEHPEQADRLRGLVAAELGQHSGALQ
jgi:arylsulfatase A-like enzyme